MPTMGLNLDVWGKWFANWRPLQKPNEFLRTLQTSTSNWRKRWVPKETGHTSTGSLQSGILFRTGDKMAFELHVHRINRFFRLTFKLLLNDNRFSLGFCMSWGSNKKISLPVYSIHRPKVIHRTSLPLHSFLPINVAEKRPFWAQHLLLTDFSKLLEV